MMVSECLQVVMVDFFMADQLCSQVLLNMLYLNHSIHVLHSTET